MWTALPTKAAGDVGVARPSIYLSRNANGHLSHKLRRLADT